MKTISKNPAMKLVFFLALILSIAGCGSGAGSGTGSTAGTGAIAAHLQWQDSQSLSSARMLAAPAGVTTINISVSAPDISTPITASFAASADQGTVNNIPAGANRTVTAQALNSNGTVTYTGSVGNITVIAGQTATAAINMWQAVTASFTGTWTERTSVTSNELAGVTYGNGQFVAVGGNWKSGSSWSDVVLTSPDGVNWTSQTLPSGTSGTVPAGAGNSSFVNGGLIGITYGNGQFVAVGGNSAYNSNSGNSTWSDVALTSPDGVNWTSRSLPSGTSGSSSSSGASGGLYGVTYGNGLFVAVGSSSTLTTWSDVILTSPDGVNWTSRTLPSGTSGSASGTSYGSGELAGVTYGNGLFVAVGSSWSSTYNSASGNSTSTWSDTILTSPDGVNWTSQTLPSGTSGSSSSSSLSTTVNLVGVTYGNGLFVAVGSSWSSTYNSASGTSTFAWSDTILTSPDGVNWTSQTLPPGTSGSSSSSSSSSYYITELTGVTYGNGQFVAVGSNWGYTYNSSSGYTYTWSDTILSSPDGINWTLNTLPSGTSGTESSLTYGLFGIAYSNGKFVTVGDQGAILTSP